MPLLLLRSQGEFVEERCGEDCLRSLPVNAASNHLPEGVSSHAVCINHAEQVPVLLLLPMGMEDQENDSFGTS